MKYMYGWFIMMNLVYTCSLFPVDTLSDKLDEAISNQDIPALQSHLHALEAEQIDPQEKKVLLFQLLQRACDLLDEESSKGLLNNPWDLARFLVGGLVTVSSLVVLHTVDRDRNKGGSQYCRTCWQTPSVCTCSGVPKRMSPLQRLYNCFPYLALAVAGYYQMYRGIMGASHTSRVDTLRSIRDMLREKACSSWIF